MATRSNLGARRVYFADGIRLYGRAPHVTETFLDRIAVFARSADFLTATFVTESTSSTFVVPSSMIVFQNHDYAVDAGLGPGP